MKLPWLVLLILTPTSGCRPAEVRSTCGTNCEVAWGTSSDQPLLAAQVKGDSAWIVRGTGPLFSDDSELLHVSLSTRVERMIDTGQPRMISATQSRVIWDRVDGDNVRTVLREGGAPPRTLSLRTKGTSRIYSDSQEGPWLVWIERDSRVWALNLEQPVARRLAFSDDLHRWDFVVAEGDWAWVVSHGGSEQTISRARLDGTGEVERVGSFLGESVLPKPVVANGRLYLAGRHGVGQQIVSVSLAGTGGVKTEMRWLGVEDDAGFFVAIGSSFIWSWQWWAALESPRKDLEQRLEGRLVYATVEGAELERPLRAWVTEQDVGRLRGMSVDDGNLFVAATSGLLRFPLATLKPIPWSDDEYPRWE